MTRTIEMQTEFEGENDDFRLRFEKDYVEIEVKAFEGHGGKYIRMPHADFDRIVAERDNFRRLNANLEAA